MSVNPQTFAKSVLQLLQTDPRNYLNFGVYWFFVKDVLKRYYTRENLHLLGEYQDPTVIARMPVFDSLEDAFQAAIAEYNHNRMHNLGRNTLIDPEGESFLLNDEDY